MGEIEKNKGRTIKEIGAKAYNLNILEKNLVNVPKWFCVIDEEDKINEYLEKEFKDNSLFSVRSSTNLEDGENLSFAGQFETLLFVEKDNVLEAINKVKEISSKVDISSYTNTLREKNKNEKNKNEKDKKAKIKSCVIVQVMIDSEKSGVMFTQNPNGILNEMVIVCGKGVGNNVVEDKVPTSTYYFNKTDKSEYFEKQKNAERLEEKEKNDIVKIGLEIEKIYGKPMDIEWCIKEGKIYILQARPITTFSIDENNIILDNSNIVESYPGVTLPLTIGFVKDMYYQIFKNLLIRLTNDVSIVEKYEEILKDMVDSSNGRMYYRISNWYFILSFLPAKNRIIKIWQEMLGVTTKKVTIDKRFKISGITKIKVIKSGVKLFKENPSNMKKLEGYFKTIKDEVENELEKENSNIELLKIYNKLINGVMQKWDYTLINDLYSFVYTSFVKNDLKKNKNEEDINKYISQIKNLESLKPINEMVNIAKYIKENNLSFEIENIADTFEYNKYICGNTELSKKISGYIEIYGDRNLEELKLETKTFRTHPVIFLKRLLEFAKDDNLYNIINEENRICVPEKNMKLEKYKNKAMTGIMYREQSRLNRCRIYGLVRKIMLLIGGNLVEEGRINSKEDIFYLDLEDIMQLENGQEINFKQKIQRNKEMYNINIMLPQYSRLIYDTKIIEKIPLNINKIETKFNDEILRGIPSSSGIIKAEVVLIEDINKSYDISRKDFSYKINRSRMGISYK